MSLFFYMLSIISSVWLYFNFTKEYYIVPISLIILGFIFEIRKNKREDYNSEHHHSNNVQIDFDIEKNKSYFSSSDCINDMLIADNILLPDEMPKLPKFPSYQKNITPDSKVDDNTSAKVDDISLEELYAIFMEKECDSSLNSSSKDEDLILQINKEKGRKYEAYIAKVFRLKGYQVDERGKRLGRKDGGVDLVVTKNNETILVQCKNYKPTTKIDHIKVKEFNSNCSTFVIKKSLSFSSVRFLMVFPHKESLKMSAVYVFDDKSNKCEYEVIK